MPYSNTASRHSDRQFGSRLNSQLERRVGKGMLFRAGVQPAGRRVTPSNVSPVVTNRQSAMTSLRASVTIIVLRVPLRLSAVRALLDCGSELSLCNVRKRQDGRIMPWRNV